MQATTNKHIEDTATEHNLPTNALPILARLREVLEELQTNTLHSESARKDDRVARLVWLLNEQYYGELATIHMGEEWAKIYEREV